VITRHKARHQSAPEEPGGTGDSDAQWSRTTFH
jgi:hypothetical protein